MRVSITVAVLVLSLFAVTATAQDFRYAAQGGGGLTWLTGGDLFEFEQETTYQFGFGHRIGERWLVELGYSAVELNNDTDAPLSDSAGGLFNNSPLTFDAQRLSLYLSRYLLGVDRPLNLTFGAGGGLLIWEGVNPNTDQVYEVRGEKLEPTDFSASELFLGTSAGIVVAPSSRLSLNVRGYAEYLTGAGADLEPDLSDARDRWLLGAVAMLSIHLGGQQSGPSFQINRRIDDEPSMVSYTAGDPGRRDGDADGVPDDRDRCLNTPRGARVNNDGCPIDGDRDGVPDGLDDCPGTLPEARDFVDIHGCPYDSDFDGMPDYTDACPNNSVGARIDTAGCPVDGDNDGVPDGLDDCPNTLPGVAVDPNGCIDLEMFSRPMVLNIDYVPGSFEVDPHNLERLRKLAGLLNFVEDIRLEIVGYTDNIGTEIANRQLSEKRARRVMDYLETYGVEPSRMKAIGRGETNFIASNQTAEGRRKNRRIEITFYR